MKYQAVNFVNPTKTQTWTYDPVGNRLTATDTQAGNAAYTTLSGNKIGSVSNLGWISHDGRGNMVADGSGWAYTYDAKNRLIEARNSPSIDASTQKYEFGYDGLNRRVIEKYYTKASGSATWTLAAPSKYRYYKGWDLVEVHEPTTPNTPTRVVEAYVHGPRVDETLRYRRYQYDSNGNLVSTGSYYLQENALGSTVRILDAQTGNGVLRVRYDVYGKASFAEENSPNNFTYYNSISLRFLYTGREMLVDANGGIGSGLYDYRNRVYTTTLGRFLQTDPIRFQAGDVNLYRYVGNNVVNYIDPFGREGCSATVVVGHGNPNGCGSSSPYCLNNAASSRGNANNIYVGCGADGLNAGGLGDSMRNNNASQSDRERYGCDTDEDPNSDDYTGGENLGPNVHAAIETAFREICARECCKGKTATVNVECLPGGGRNGESVADILAKGKHDFCGKTRSRQCPG